MSKLKIKRGWSKRIKVKKSGIIMRRKAGKRHLQTSKSRKRKRRLSKSVRVSQADVRRIKGFNI